MDQRNSFKDCLIKFCIFIVFISFFGIFLRNRDYIDDMFRGEKIVQEGEFTILDKNTTNIRVFLVSNNTFTFTLESNTKERYVVQVSERIYQSYFINDKIKATFDTYSKSDTYGNFKVEGIVANE
ncbi:MAG: hypothetical protein HFJ09_09435 [Lachnospiraceae bacterium]|nr:hypothetical protein [Lachnospiraceae bacterium]